MEQINPAQFKEKYVEIGPYINWFRLQRIPAHKVAYLEFGDPENKNVIVCAHGLTRNAYDFTKIASSLSKDFRVIALTYPGRGNSDIFNNKSHYNYQVYLKETSLFLEKLAIKQAFWLGSSMGGIIGMVLAGLSPKTFKGLILNDIGPFIPGNTLAKIGKYAKQTPVFDDLLYAKQHLKMIYSAFAIKDEEDWDHMTKYSFTKLTCGRYQMHYDPAIVHSMKGKGKAKDVNLWHAWYKISCPILVIHGTKSDILQQSTVEEMQRTKKLDLYSVSYAGHAPSLMTQDQIEAVRSWLISHF